MGCGRAEPATGVFGRRVGDGRVGRAVVIAWREAVCAESTGGGCTRAVYRACHHVPLWLEAISDDACGQTRGMAVWASRGRWIPYEALEGGRGD
jgi:hypothetical protein